MNWILYLFTSFGEEFNENAADYCKYGICNFIRNVGTVYQ
jgi:hypothetical protein